MSTEGALDVCVPDTLKIPQSNGAPIWKLSIELFLTIAERLDSASCLTFSQACTLSYQLSRVVVTLAAVTLTIFITRSQTCRTLFILSNERSIYWRSAQFAHGLLPRITQMSAFTGAELRSTAVKSINLEWKWEDSSPMLVRRVPVRTHLRKERYFVPSGSRWLFQYGSHRELRTATVFIFDMVTGKHIGESRFPQATQISRIVGQSLAPDFVAFAIQLENAFHVAICTARFHERDGVVGKQVVNTVDTVQMQAEVIFTVFQDGILGVATEEEVVVQQWDKPATRWNLAADWSWVPRGLQIARDRLLVLERKDGEEQIKLWRIRVFDISVVRNGVVQNISDDIIQQLRFIDSVDMLHAPVEPFYAPYWEDRIGEGGVHFGFKTLLLMHTQIGENLWHCDLRLDTDINQDGTTEERLTVAGTYIVGQNPDERPTQFIDGFALGPKASRIVWTSENGVTRIRSDWTDDNASDSRLLNMRSVPMSIPRLLTFDELFGVVIQSDSSTHHSISYFI